MASLTATGTAIKWYVAATGGSALAATTALPDGRTYYATQTVNSCESVARLAVTVYLAPVITLLSATSGPEGLTLTGVRFTRDHECVLQRRDGLLQQHHREWRR